MFLPEWGLIAVLVVCLITLGYWIGRLLHPSRRSVVVVRIDSTDVEKVQKLINDHIAQQCRPGGILYQSNYPSEARR